MPGLRPEQLPVIENEPKSIIQKDSSCAVLIRQLTCIATAQQEKIQKSGGPHIDQGAVFMSSYAEKLLTAGVVAANTVGREQCLKFAAMNW